MIKKIKELFSYWFAHWCAVQMVAINLGCWKPRFLFHDWYKPWLRLIGFNRKQVQKFHRKISGHHNGSDLVGMVVDWESSRYTKPDAPLNARDTLYQKFPERIEKVEPILKKLNL